VLGAERRGEIMSDDRRPEYRVRGGGLMRCCLRSLDELEMTAAEMPKEGEKLHCIYCSHDMIYRDGAWEWAGGPRA